MLSYEFLVGRLGKIIDLEESGLNADLQIAKQQLQCGLLNQSESTLKTIIASGNEDKIPACNYTLGKVYYAMNHHDNPHRDAHSGSYGPAWPGQLPI